MTNLCFLSCTKNDDDTEEYFTRTSFLKYWKNRGNKNIFETKKN